MGVFDSEARSRIEGALDASVPGCAELGAVAYVENLLTAFDHDPPHIWASPDGGWLEMGPWEAHAWRARIEEWRSVYGRVGADAPADGDLDVVHTHACEAAYGDPVYGGNRDEQGWVRVAFPTPIFRPGFRS